MLGRRVVLAALASGMLVACSSDDKGACEGVTGECVAFEAGATEHDIQTALVSAKPGTTFRFAAGTFTFQNALVLDGVANVTLEGAGAETTVLDFKGQLAGSEALSATRTDGLAVRNLHVRDAKGDGIKVLGTNGVSFQHVRVTWTGANPTAHGAYGLYPVQSKQVLIEDCYVAGASDAGIYVGQSEDIVVRRNEATQNVAGIEIENSHRADVYENNAHANTGGILVFGLPGLQVPDVSHVRVFRNQLVENNTANFAPKGNTVGTVPAGTGMLVMAAHDVEVFENTFTGNKTVGVSVVSYLLLDQTPDDAAFNPDSYRVYLHNNTFSQTGTAPDMNNPLGAALGALAQYLPGGRVPDHVYDGIPGANASARLANNPMELCIGTATSFVNVNAADPDAQGNWTHFSTDVAPYACTLAPLTAVTLQQVP
ncbi:MULTISPECIES: parallel beta-helix domain-containing protein [Myxococcaceae]|uniref:parallel beta-helix domain-containing protein n=1 Tax=Myxococcaceae TaxID=31 RepID=UPI001E6469C8|nr:MULTISPECIES: parallel beta-helix domain-containing protein [Myxococcaceae]